MDILSENKSTYHVQIFSGVSHGFAVRGDPEVENSRKSILQVTEAVGKMSYWLGINYPYIQAGLRRSVREASLLGLTASVNRLLRTCKHAACERTVMGCRIQGDPFGSRGQRGATSSRVTRIKEMVLISALIAFEDSRCPLANSSNTTSSKSDSLGPSC